jgi:hypothetical protein
VYPDKEVELDQIEVDLEIKIDQEEIDLEIGQDMEVVGKGEEGKVEE